MIAARPAATTPVACVAAPRTPSLRDAMPRASAFIDAMRDAFGRADIDAAIRAGMNGTPGFWVRENGREAGTRDLAGTEVSVSAPAYVRRDDPRR